ncbi:MAG: PAS domain-containing protein [Candidatus Hydrogenedentes bacterium]|nr:PAS domain-containing protein [Candidatus Hydrogenedentota bacterium]
MKPITILFAEGDASNRLALHRSLPGALPECRLVGAETAGECLRLLEHLRPDCVLVYTTLRDMDAVELCTRISGLPGRDHLPILLLTEQDAPAGLHVKGLEAGADEVYHRAGDPTVLVSKIRVLLRMKKAEDQLRAVNKNLAEVAAMRSKELHASDERFRLLFHTCSEAVMVLELLPDNRAGAILEVNEVGCHLLGYTRDEVRGLELKDLFRPTLVPLLNRRIAAILKHKQIYFETELLAKDGHLVPFHVNSRVFDFGDRRTIIYVARVAAEFQSHPKGPAGRIHDLVAQTGQLVYETNLATGKILWSGAMEQITGMTSKDSDAIDLATWMDLVHPDDRARVMAVTDQAVKSVGKYHVEYRLRYQDGSWRHLEDMGVVLPDAAAEAFVLMGNLKDITSRVENERERQVLEQTIQHSKKLESLGVLAGGIAHDFNNILAAIIGLTDMSLQDIPKDTGTYEDLSEALKAAHRAKDLVNQILAFSRQAGEERAPLYLHVVAREAMKLFQSTMPQYIELMDSVDVHSGVVLANATQMHQVVMNYCLNAAQALKNRGGRIEVRVEDVEVTAGFAATHPKLKPGPYVRLSVRDNGHGMDPLVAKRIFDPFFTTKGPGEGTGMGLAVVHGIVTSHDGVVILVTAPGQGATFYTYLPRIGSEVFPDPVRAALPAHGEECVLFVDDELAILRFGTVALERMGYKVILCNDGAEALRLFQDTPDRFDVVVTDQKMTPMSGLALAREIKAIRPSCPVILFTGFSDEMDGAMDEEGIIDEIVHKPVIGARLAETVRRILDKSALKIP